ncbi:hypothetical protein JTE90_001606 [Oedothorax gibbosus]|uniref:Insulin receptor substrate 1 n=1 Tax=Oedothorax gibbosus TaxID=931172 RepID=A0AAV6VLK8_9ARAC|nr:hypothetical protein JTE90_001606 [Oedothorax gibbosus]
MSDRRENRNSVSSVIGFKLPHDVKKAGLLRKLKTMKKKYFVLRTDSDSGAARLEYYDNEKKFKAGQPAKRSIPIKTCFNINRKVDAKHKFAIALYTKDDCFSVVADNEDSCEEWLIAMLELQLDDPCMNGGAKLKPKFEHVWQVTVGDKSLASSRNMKGLYRLCLTPSALALIKVDQTDKPETLEFPLMGIRRCGHTNNYFVIELGRSSVTGAGELWLETEDVVIAQNMHEVTLNAMKTCREHEDLGPLARPRSASNSENSRPISTRRPVAVVNPQTVHVGVRDRCDSMPSRPRTISEGQEINNRPVSATCSTDSAGSSLSIDEFDAGQQTDFTFSRYSHSHPTDAALHTEPPIKEEQLDDYVPMSVGSDNSDSYLNMAPMSSSVPNGPSVFLHLNSSDSSHSSSLPPIAQANDYMEMKSPTEGYINMSPLGAAIEKTRSSSSLDTSVSESANQKDGYIHMAPIRDHTSLVSSTGHYDGYLDMAPLSSSLPKTLTVVTNQNGLSSRKDSSTKLAETPASSPSSTNLKDFPLDKVKSLLADADDSSCDSYIRPVRAYSMGSRPQPKKSLLPLQVDGSRIRAYSVGSQASTRKKINTLDRELGSLMDMDPRTGTKSSSAPLLLSTRPPRVRSSTSRSEVKEDLMEIDYNRAKYTSGGIDLLDSNFTIEPVGRSRSGSYSTSPSNALKFLHDRDKAKSHSTGHSCHSSRDDSQATSDYLSMSPVSDHGKSLSRSSISVSPSASPSNSMQRRSEPLHPPGDYVSLDPSSVGQTYSSGLLRTSSTGGSFRSQRSKSPSSLSSPDAKTALSQISSLKPAVSDYMCMDYNTISSQPAAPANSNASDYFFCGPSTTTKQDRESSPSSTAALPRTPPPSPSYGAICGALAGAPFMDNLVRRLSQPIGPLAETQPGNSPPHPGEVRLNYASLDLPPSSEDDVPKLRKSLEGDAKEASPTYAQIDFSSPAKQKSFQDSENLSHL